MMDASRRIGPGLRAALAGASLLSVFLAACSPALDWREVAVGGGPLVALFPCKPTTQERPLPSEAGGGSATLQVCDAQGLTFAALSLPQQKGAAGGEAMARLRESAAARWGERAAEQANSAAVRLPPEVQLHWQRHTRSGADGKMILTQALFMAHGDRLWQISVSGPQLDAATLETFFTGLRIPA